MTKVTEIRVGSSVGQTRKDPDTGEEFEVVWDGGPLLGPRVTRITDPTWEPPRRLYNKKPEKVIDLSPNSEGVWAVEREAVSQFIFGPNGELPSVKPSESISLEDYKASFPTKEEEEEEIVVTEEEGPDVE